MKKKIKFRPHSFGDLMTDGREKSNKAKYLEAVDKVEALLAKMEATKNKETKTYKGYEERLEKYKAERDRLEPLKDLFKPSATCEKTLKTIMIEHRYNRRKRVETKYTKKGKEKEEEGITLYGELVNEPFVNNKQRKELDFGDYMVSGEIDIPIFNEEGEVIAIRDIKNRYDIDTLFDNDQEEVSKKDYWQLMGYFLLYPEAKEAGIVNVLLNNTYELIQYELRREEYEWDQGMVPPARQAEIIADNVFDLETFNNYCNGFISVADKDTEEYKEYLEYRSKFVEIPKHERCIEVLVERCEKDIERLKERISDCAKWLNLKYGL